jgi:6-phosphofructokinase 1
MIARREAGLKTLAILVGGGPAPGINAVIAAATIEARTQRLRVLGCYDGFRWLARGDAHHVVELDTNLVSRIHFDGGSILRTSRVDPTGTPGGVERVAETLRGLGVDHLIAIGGHDTASAVSALARAAPGLGVAHVPKTIDNDLPLPGDVMTIGYTTACNFGKEIVRNLVQDAETSERWFFVSVMGRQAGHLALGIGAVAGTLTVIAEEFPEPRITLDRIADVLEGAVIKRRAQGREHGVALLSEGVAHKLDPAALGSEGPDGASRGAESNLARALRDRVVGSLRSRRQDVVIVAKDVGYELRCAPPGAHDIQYGRSLGYWATRFLLDGGRQAMVTIQAGRLVPIPFEALFDSTTGRIRVRHVDVGSETYRTLYAYMTRLKPEDVGDPENVGLLAEAGGLSETDFVTRFAPLVGA